MNVAEILLEPEPTLFWRVLRQVGVDHAVGRLPRRRATWRSEIADEQAWDYAPLLLYKELVEGEGLALAVIEDSPPMERIWLGDPGREEEIEHFATLLRNMGKLGIPVLCYNWMGAAGWLRTSTTARGRGGAIVTAYDHALLEHAPPLPVEMGEEQLWQNLRYFLERVVPVAEEAGVRLAMHPDDPPISPLRGVPRIMRSPEAFERLFELVPSPANGLTLCQGNFTLMTGDLPSVIRAFGREGKIFFVHFRDVRGEPTSFVETFHDEGQTDMLECMRAYRDVGFAGCARSDHVPTLEGDRADVPGYSHLGRLFAIGYIAGLREAAYGRVAP